jgi:hypothetical protein
MRFGASLSIALLVLFAGCIEDKPGAAPVDDTPVAEPLPPLPANFTEEVQVTGGVDAYNFIPAATPLGGGGPCSSPQSSCSKFPFTLNRTADVRATLDWSMDGYDFDVYLMQDGADVSAGAGASGATSASVASHEEFSVAGAAAGDYEIWVSHWLVPQDTYTLVVEFS